MKRKIIKKSHEVGFKPLEIFEGETIEKKCARIVENNEPISDGAPLVYTEKKKGVLPEYNIRTDKWEIAQEAMDKVNREKIAKGIQLETGEQPKAKISTDGKTADGSASTDANAPT